ncbi:mannose-1-phosphate guanylyltransferase [Clostridium brassicae]|uniref:Sugar phosphate nucleotidyltransferase n=1 Tax=Clostridium brassicae TaxID=2999072 RepID=A0ABT4DDQ0_9CLOT|nr:sugar phosphate nucleotidyltransferase [Clostridium brassicae]MCY6959266.1 sugar phosphate nucleotidyltransferase [Clostridium brassicae]
MVILNCENAALKVTYIVYKETATCIGLSAVKLLKKDKDAVMLVLPSDHYIQNNKKFIDTISQAIQIAERRRGLVTIGVNPTRPETGYGYIQIGDRVGGDIPTYKVERFTEKPNLEVAKDFLVDGNYLWNSGMFVWRADVFLREMEKYLPKMYKNLMEIYKDVGSENEEETIKEQYNLIEGISVDFGIMQKTRKAYTIKCEFIWDDIGSFSSMTRFLNEFRGNNILGKTFLEESEDCFVFSKDKLIIGFGIKDLIIVDAGDVLLVMDKNKDQELKHLVNQIKEEKEYEEYL